MFWERARLQSLLSAAEGRRSEPQQMPALAPEGRTSRPKNHLRSVSNTRWNHLLSRLKRVECLRKSPGELVERFHELPSRATGTPQPAAFAGWGGEARICSLSESAKTADSSSPSLCGTPTRCSFQQAPGEPLLQI